MKRELTVDYLKAEAQAFAQRESVHKEKSLFGVTDGKAVGTYLEHKFQTLLQKKFKYTCGSSAKGIDFPQLLIDIKVTSFRQPQSSCPYTSAKQKIYGLGYSLLVFVYDKQDHRTSRTSTLLIRHVIYIDKEMTGDFQTTTGLVKILENEGNIDDLVAYMTERYLPIDEIQVKALAEELLRRPPQIGYLTISNALQWRLQYARVIEKAGKVDGIHRLI